VRGNQGSLAGVQALVSKNADEFPRVEARVQQAPGGSRNLHRVKYGRRANVRELTQRGPNADDLTRESARFPGCGNRRCKVPASRMRHPLFLAAQEASDSNSAEALAKPAGMFDRQLMHLRLLALAKRNGTYAAHNMFPNDVSQR